MFKADRLVMVNPVFKVLEKVSAAPCIATMTIRAI